MADSTSLSAGDRLGPYQIVAPIGKGGMGQVYRARDTRLGRDVAIKVSNAKFTERFAGEARAIAALNHPNICTLYDVGPDYLVMELVEGPTLADRIQQGPLPAEEAVRIARQIGEALDAAHEKNIVHRDLKPANVKVKPDGLVKVLDFGLAKAMEPHDSGADLTASPTLTLEATRAGMILGTAGYMSPEQARGKTVDHRSDIWAFGVVFYEMLTGRTTFEGETVSDTLAAVLRAEIDWSQLPAGTPVKIRRLLKRCLERDPKRRLRDIGDAWLDLDTPDEPTAAASPSRGALARWLPWACAALIAAGGIGWGLFHSSPQTPASVVRSSFSPETPVGVVALSPDGNRLAYAEFSGSVFRLMSRSMDSLEPLQIPGAKPGLGPVFSPDGQWIAYFAGNVNSNAFKLEKIPATGGTSTTLCEAGNPGGLSWGDDGSIVFGSNNRLMRISSAGGTPQPLIPADANKAGSGQILPSFLPGSKAVLFTIASGAARQVALLDVAKGIYRILIQSGASPAYVPTGHLLFVRDTTAFAVPFDLRRRAVTGPEFPVIEGSSSVFKGGTADFAVSNSGVLVYVAGVSQGSKSVLAFVDAKGAAQPVSDPEAWGTGRLSPDGRRVANSIAPNSGVGDIWSFEIERRTLTRLTFEGQYQHPVWTPDGRRVVFARAAGKDSGLYWVPADGSGKATLLATADESNIPYSWSPDGHTLVFSQAGTDKNTHLWTLFVPAAGSPGKPVPLHESPFSETDAQVSPEGHWLAYVSNESGGEEVYVQPFPGSGEKVRISTSGGFAPRWSHDGRELFYWGGARQTLFAVDTQTTSGFKVGIPRELFKMPVGTTWDVAPDGKHFLVEQIPGINGGGRIVTVANWFEELRRRVPAEK